MDHYYLPPNACLVASVQTPNRMVYAGVRQTNEADSAFDVLEGRRIPLIWYKAGEDIRFYRLSSRPPSGVT